MEEVLEPFADEEYKLQEIDGRMTLKLHGELHKSKKIEADKIPKLYEAMREGWDINIQHAVINGDIDIRVAGLKTNDQSKYIIAGRMLFIAASFAQNAYFYAASFARNASFRDASFAQDADFRGASFTQTASFIGASFTQDADFRGASFTQDAYFRAASFALYADFIAASFAQTASFRGASFAQTASFSGASFTQDADFIRASFEYPGDFSGVIIRENTVKVGLYNDILRRVVKFLTRGKKILESKQVTDVSRINTQTVIDSSSNPYLKRYIDDEQWIKSWRERGGKGKEALFIIWEATSHCGRSMGLWAAWSTFFALAFALIFTPAPDWWPHWWWNIWRVHGLMFEQTAPSLQGQPVGFLSCLYFSIVNFTTLGFGDIVAINRGARALVTFEVVLGYVMLGGLISIFANKFARRS